MRHVWVVALLAAGSLLPTATGCRSASGPLARLENSAIYAPAKYPEGNWVPIELRHEDAWFAAEDGTLLHGWYCPHPNPRAVVLYAHGNAGNLSHRAELLRRLHDEHGLAVMTFDYRGYGKSEGTPNEAGILQDARAARQWLALRAGIDPRDVVLMGRSLGGAVAVDLAAREGARGLILESTFTSMPEVAADHFSWPIGLVMNHRLRSIDKIGNYHGPLLMSHGDADRVIEPAHGQRLFAAANEPKRFVAIPGSGHNDPQTSEYYRALDEFIAALPAVTDKRTVPDR